MLRRLFVCVLLAVPLALVPHYQFVPSASAWPISVAGDTGGSGTILALTVRTSNLPRDLDDVAEGLGFGDGVGHPVLVPARDLVERLGPGERTDMAAAAANGWLAANRLRGTELEYRSIDVVVDVEEGSVADASGIGEGDVVALLNDRVLSTEAATVRHLRYRDIYGVKTLTFNESVALRPALMVTRRSHGQSVGLASALAYLDHLTPGGITGGRTIAATGVIQPSGWVSSVTNAGLKAQAAVLARADVLFVPVENFDDACAGAGAKVPVVAVRHLADALAWLDGRRDSPTCR